MSIIVTNIRTGHLSAVDEIIDKAVKSVRLDRKSIFYAGLYRESLDLRHNQISKICSVELKLRSAADEQKISDKYKSVYIKPEASLPEVTGKNLLSSPPVVVGFGPAGLFAALMLAERGMTPIVFERGSSIHDRDIAVSSFFNGNDFNENTNIQFGEGGAGTYSDGKLTTRINDPFCQTVLNVFKQHGAPDEVLRLAKPHIGTDLLKKIVVSIRNRIESLGGKVYFDTPVTGFKYNAGHLTGIITSAGFVDTEVCVLAIGHSARDTVSVLNNDGFHITPKAFSVGLRIEHLQKQVNESVYGQFADDPSLPPAEYTLSVKPNDRGCYSFCMCPGGYVIAAASEQGGVVTNGMSMHDRRGSNANSAICVSVLPSDFDFMSPLAGIEFQRKIERAAFKLGGGNYYAPVQTVGDFMNGSSGSKPSEVHPSYPIGYTLADFSDCMPAFITSTIRSAMPLFARRLKCFGLHSGVFTGVETRTSSPVRIVRDAEMNSVSVKGLIPCGEGAGYAGGIMSAAVDGIRAAAAIMSKYRL